MIEYIYEGKVIYRVDKMPVPRESEYVYIKEQMYRAIKVVYLVEKKIIQVHLV